MKTLTIVVPISSMAGKLNNLSSWLCEALDFDVEVRLVHDFHDEDTSREVQVLVKQLNNNDIIFIEMKFGSPGLARNHGLKGANSKWVMFVDSDDILELKQVFFLIERAQNNNQILVGNFRIVNLSDATEAASGKLTRSRVDLAMNPGLWRLILPLSLARQHSFTEHKMGEDQEYLLGLDIFSRDLYFSQNIIYTYYRNNPGQLTSNPEAVLDLSKIIPKTVAYVGKSKFRVGIFISIILVRQLATELKNTKMSRPRLLFKQIKETWDLKLIKKIQIVLAVLIVAWKLAVDV